MAKQKKKSFKDDRALRRQTVGDGKNVVTAVAEFQGREVTGNLTDFHFQGAGIEFSDSTLNVDELKPMNQIGLKIGSSWINMNLGIRVCWTNPEEAKLGVQFLVPRMATEDGLVEVSCVKPTISCIDPFHVGRVIVGEVVALGPECLVMETSLTNQFLLPGCMLSSCELYFPSLGTSKLTCRVISACVDDNSRARFLLRMDERDGEYPKLFVKYSLAFESKARLDWAELGEEYIPKSLKGLLTFRKVNNAIEYLKVLKLRLKAYQGRDVELHTAKVREMGDGLSSEGVIIGGYLGGSMVCTMELRFGSQNHTFRVEEWIDRRELSRFLDMSHAMEVNKLAIDPALHGTDVVMGVMQRLSTIAGSNGGLYFLFSATDEMRKQYLAVGGIDVGVSYPHPYLKETRLHIMIFPREVYSQGSGINPYFWLRVYSQVNDFLADHGFDRKKVLTPSHKAATVWYRKLHELKKMWSRRSKSKKKT